MSNDCIKKNGNVVLVDPNCVNVNTNQVNAIPSYEKMHIYVDLVARRRGRTILFTGNSSNTATNDKSIRINMMGFNQNIDDPNYEKFTTNYYDGSTGSDRQYESFGIQSIKTTINSSFIPQVEIRFVDIRGLSFFNQGADKETSPYRILFDFPPPIFELTIKGYYGKALRYKLHLVNYTTEFSSENGNFIINANFVAITFAPLADILFKYIINFALMEGGGVNPNNKEQPNNTFELILKTKTLLTALEHFKEDNRENKKFNETINNIGNVSGVISFLATSKESSKLVGIGNTPIFFIRDKAENDETGEFSGELIKIDSIAGYNDLIVRKQVVGTVEMDERLYIGFELGETRDGVVHPIFDEARVLKMKSALNELKNEILNKAKTDIGGGNIFDTKIKNAEVLESKYDFTQFIPDNLARYVVLDITDFYLYLYNLLNELNDEKDELADKLNTVINNLILENLGMLPTIYNIFKIILNDVDTFFNILRKTSYEAYRHHNDSNIKQIILNSNFRDVGGKEKENIYSFPLVIRTKNQCGRKVEERIAPIEISNILSNSFGSFPELVLIENFIETFRTQQYYRNLFDMLGSQNADGTYEWIPISPFDSKLASERLSSPYIRIDSSAGGAQSRPIPLGEDSRLDTLFKILLERYYVLSQYVIPEKFKSTDNIDKELILMHADAEAVNVGISIFNKNLRDNIIINSDKFKRNIDLFVEYVEKNLPNYYNGIGENDDNQYINLREPIYVNKNGDDYVGCKIITKNIDLIEAVIGDNSAKPIDIFRKEIVPQEILKRFNRYLFGKPSIEYVRYLNENLFYFPDGITDNGRNVENDIILHSRFCLPNSAFPAHQERTNQIQFGAIVKDKEKYINDVITKNENRFGGNDAIYKFEYTNAAKLNVFGEMLDVWVNYLTYKGEIIYDKIFNYNNSDKFNPRLSSILLLGNFGLTASPFNTFGYNLNKHVFTLPSVVNVPAFLPLYIGALVDIEIGGETYNQIYDFFMSGDGITFSSGGIQIFADIVDIKQKLSKNEREEFKLIYDDWYANARISPETGFGRLILNMDSLFDKYFNDPEYPYKNDYRKKEKKIKELLAPNGEYFLNTIGHLSKNNYILNYSEITFKYNDLSESEYKPLSQVRGVLLSNTRRFATRFFTRLVTELTTEKKDETDLDAQTKKLTGDEDIVTQTYYSFKNINDKWLVEPEHNESQMNGYPFNGSKKNLIDLFAFVDRGMNPVGDTIINPEALIELAEDYDASVFTVLSTLLSNNGFEFFPLQNFMLIEYDDDKQDNWTESFKINSNGKMQDSPFFVCMYIGGSSRMVSGIEKFGNFESDGIVDLLNPGTGHFSSTNECGDGFNDRDAQKEGNSNFPWGEVRAFRVRFAEQNQSMFKDFRIDSKEFPETNESIQILSRLAGDNRANAPIPKGQNLYNLYENRAYSATITGLGNAMIQPTQYFQLENIPLYNGAYLILNVEHTIEANKMTTMFSGTKILKYPIPRVTNPAAILGFDGAASDATRVGGGRVSAGDIILGAGTAGNPDGAKYNSMYTQKIIE